VSLFEGDVELLQLNGGQLRIAPPIEVMGANGPHWVGCIQVEVKILHNDQQGDLMDWILIDAIVYPGDWQPHGPRRMSGMFLHQNVFTATAPDGQGNL
jgi:hypothetical protein